MQTQLKVLLDEKGSRIFTVAPQESVGRAVEVMNEARIGAVLVADESTPLGIFTERDVLQRVVARRLDPAGTPVADVMTRELVVVRPNTSVEDAMAVVTATRCRHLPVMDAGRLLGMVSSGDLTRWVTRDREVEIQQLVDYITGKYPA